MELLLLVFVCVCVTMKIVLEEDDKFFHVSKSTFCSGQQTNLPKTNHELEHTAGITIENVHKMGSTQEL